MKLLKILFFSFILLIVASYFLVNYGLKVATAKTLEMVPSRASEFGLVVHDISFDNAYISSYNSISWSRPRAKVSVKNDKLIKSSLVFSTELNQLTMKLLDLGGQMYSVSADGIVLETEGRSANNTSDVDKKLLQSKLLDGTFRLNFTIDLMSPLRSLRPLLSELIYFARHGETEADLDFQGVISSSIKNQAIVLGVYSEKEDRKSRLKVRREDLSQAASLLDLRLTESELDILASNPQKSPDLLSIKNYAQDQAKKISIQDERISEDAYRHILWSYTLTKTYGEVFAEQVTDAHEKGMTGNTKKEMEQDYNNNSIGRAYAKAGISESAIADRMLRDPNVITEYSKGWQKSP
jgi:hypothetical protein